MMPHQEQVLEMLAAWRLAKPWARVDPKTLRIASVSDAMCQFETSGIDTALPTKLKNDGSAVVLLRSMPVKRVCIAGLCSRDGAKNHRAQGRAAFKYESRNVSTTLRHQVGQITESKSLSAPSRLAC